MSTLINNWIKTGKQFNTGVTVYKILGKDQGLKDLFAKGPSAFAKQELERVLMAMITPAPAPVVDPVQKIPAGKITDPVARSYRDRWMPLYQEMNALRHDLDKYQGNSTAMIIARKPMAFRIRELERQCNAIWSEADHYQKTGQVPLQKSDDDMPVPEDLTERSLLIENTRRNIRRNRQKMQAQPGNTRVASLYLFYKAYFLKLTGTEYQEEKI